MNQQTFDPRWQQLQARIDKFVGHLLREDIPAIEYRSNISGLLPSPIDRREREMKKVS